MTPEEVHEHRRADDPIVITTRDIYEKLVDVSRVVDKLATDSDANTLARADHETRLRALERKSYALPASLVLALAALVGSIINGRW